MSRPLALLDAASLYFRAYYALPDSMTAPDGTVVNAVRGFTDTIARILTDRRPGRLVACMDADWRPAFRVEALPSYKAHRLADPVNNVEEVPDTLTPQVPIILDLLDAVGLAVAEADGYEADDVIGTLVAREATDPVEVVSGDRDLFQVVRDEPTPAAVIYVGRGWAKAEVLGPRELAERYALPPENSGPAYADMALLRGDPSDGLPGVAGVGEKTAAKLITRFGSLEGLLAAAAADDKLVPLRVKTALADAAEYVAAAPRVVRVALDADVTIDRDDAVPVEARDLDRVRMLQEKWDLGASVDRLLAALPAAHA
ncbi:5'-3' exonuclease [Actinophytocola gossypii]|uniref:5'-3' exonuclease n=1 Tax=Actinophytocola gossypii TaxID=2812003 RepID=A0ABT2J8M8_9PSEU|nr:5'-3' exonuclease H3TH domain-containing protein [Actinophytocola gossypii]MCT2583629.1 flap endonuclease [Actinophytocola gossypii]